MSVIYDHLGISKEHATAIGSLALIASIIEYILELILLGLIGTDQRYGGATIRWVSKQQQIVMIIKILKDKYGENSSTFLEMKERLEDVKIALDDRHQYVHSVYYIKPEDNFRINPGRGKFEVPKIEIDLDSMHVAIVHAAASMDQLILTAQKFSLPLPPPSLDTQPSQSPNQEDTQDQIEQEPPDPPQSSEK